MVNLKPCPPQPPNPRAIFVAELQKPLPGAFPKIRRSAGQREVAMRALTLQTDFPDTKGALETAYQDFCLFLHAAGIKDGGRFRLVTARGRTPGREAYRITVTRKQCTVEAADSEGIRRALFDLENEMLTAGGPLLALGVRERQPVVRTRILNDFFGIGLDGDTHEHPEGYLNRLAHCGINGLGVWAGLADLVPSAVIPEYGRESGPRLAKLRRLVGRCARYGIRVFLVMIEPQAFKIDSPILQAHPELGGHRVGKRVNFCPSSETGRRYLREATRTLLSEVPGLGGILNLSVGEQPTHCYSGSADRNNCPRCSRRTPDEVLGDVGALLAEGLHAVDPTAEYVSWPYTQYACWGEARAVASAGQMPPGVIVMYNFESGAQVSQLGKKRLADDYWLSFAQPSRLFTDCAKHAVQHGSRIFAKLTVAASHELGSVTHIPVPGILYDKYRIMQRLGVSGGLLSHISGTYPSLMIRASSELSFAPLPETKAGFLKRLAGPEWGPYAAQAARAWAWFEKGYGQYPVNIIFSYYGPMHNGPMWPLYLKPVDRGLAPNWMPWPEPSGDRIGECVNYMHTLEEVLRLGKGMAADWEQGVRILNRLEPQVRQNPDRRRDIRLARALGLLFHSGYRILRFYDLREKLFRAKPKSRAALLAEMKQIVGLEKEGSQRLLELTEQDPLLGYTPEAQGYKFYPAGLRWRMAQLDALLQNDFPELEQMIRRRQPLFPEYTGAQPGGTVYRCVRVRKNPGLTGGLEAGLWKKIPAVAGGYEGFRYACTTELLKEPPPRGKSLTWKACHDGRNLYLKLFCGDPNPAQLPAGSKDGEKFESLVNDIAEIQIEPRRLWPPITFKVNPRGSRSEERPGKVYLARLEEPYQWRAAVSRSANGWTAAGQIPFSAIRLGSGQELTPLRINIGRQQPDSKRSGFHTWRWLPRRPIANRLIWGTENPADFGWLVLA